MLRFQPSEIIIQVILCSLHAVFVIDISIHSSRFYNSALIFPLTQYLNCCELEEEEEEE